MHSAFRVLDLSPGRRESLPDRYERMLALGRVVVALVDDDVLDGSATRFKDDIEHIAVAMPVLRPSKNQAAAVIRPLSCSSRRACAMISARTSSVD